MLARISSGALGPDEGRGFRMMRSDEPTNGGLQLGDAAVHPAPELFVGELGEPALDEIQPRPVGRRKVDMNARPAPPDRRGISAEAATASALSDRTRRWPVRLRSVFRGRRDARDRTAPGYPRPLAAPQERGQHTDRAGRGDRPSVLGGLSRNVTCQEYAAEISLRARPVHLYFPW